MLGYTVHAVVEAVAAVGEPGCLDDSLLLILPLMEVGAPALAAPCSLLAVARTRLQTGLAALPEPPRAELPAPPHHPLTHHSPPTTPLQADLFGDVAEAKEAAEFASAYKEARKCRG